MLKRALITGFNARTASPRRATRDLSFAALLTRALNDRGWIVEHKDTSVLDDLAKYDRVFVGLASPLAVSSNRTYPALAAIGRAWAADKLVLFIDDPDIRKMLHGISSLHNKPAQLTKPFFAARADYEVACTEDWTSYLLGVNNLLRGDHEWPTLLIPAFSWSDKELIAALSPGQQANALPVDLSAYAPTWENPDLERERYWVTEESFKSKWVAEQQLTTPVKHITKTNDGLRVREYAQAWGVLEAPATISGIGWFSTRLLIALAMGAAYSTRWQTMTSVGAMYTLLPHAIERMSVDEHEHLCAQQRDRFDAMAWRRSDVQSALSPVLGETATNAEVVTDEPGAALSLGS